MDEQTTAEVVVLLNDRSCSECENYLMGPSGTWCRVYREEILSEKIASECPDYDPVPWAGRRGR